jgi:hypothetical protein
MLQCIRPTSEEHSQMRDQTQLLPCPTLKRHTWDFSLHKMQQQCCFLFSCAPCHRLPPFPLSVHFLGFMPPGCMLFFLAYRNSAFRFSELLGSGPSILLKLWGPGYCYKAAQFEPVLRGSYFSEEPLWF